MERRRKRELRDLNQRAWEGDKDVFPVQSSLDSAMKKNTGFIKRLRTAIVPASQTTFLQEIRTLSLHKYLSEIISACFEGLSKLKTPGDIAVGVEIVSALHQRFGPEEFTSYLGWYVGRGLSSPDRAQLKALPQDIREKEERERLSRQRILLRVATELWLVGVLRSLDDVARPEEAGKLKDAGKAGDTPRTKSTHSDPEPFPLEALKDLLGHDREHANLPLVAAFVKAFSWDVLGSKLQQRGSRPKVNEDGTTSTAPPESASSTETEDDGVEDTPITDSALQQRFRNILTRYFEDVKGHVVRDQKHLASQSRRNAEAYVKSGEVFEDRQANFDKQTKAQEKLVSNAQILAAALGLEMPDLTDKESANAGNDGGIGLVKTGDYLRGQTDGAGIWEDEEERRFYENLIDLRERVPGILLDDPKKKKGGDAEDEKKPDEKSTSTEKSETFEAEKKPDNDDELSTAIANKTVGAQVDALLARLPDLATREQVDQIAIDFCFLNSKASRNRLIKATQEIPKGRIDLLALYSRLIATLGKSLPDISQGIVSHLDDEFRSLQRRKSKDFLGQVRMINIRYIAELTKFGVVPEHVLFHCLKVSLDDFSRMNIEIIANLLENCGRYLLRNPDTCPRMASFLDVLQRKKSAQHLGQQERMLLENAMYYVNPPERAAIQQKERDPLDLYVRKLIYLDLSKKTLEKIIKQIRKLHWEEPEVPELLRKIFTKPGKIKFSNVYLLAVILGALHRYHQGFAISVLDDILEKITVGLETNEFKQNQKRIAEVKYLGELYTYRLVDSNLIFDTLYKLVNYGHPGGHAKPGGFCPIDLPDDFFRIRLVAALLETCGQYFDKGAVKRKLDFFLTFFQYYVFTKDPMPMDIEFVVQDLFALLRPKWEISTNLEDASKKFADACRLNYQNAVATVRDPEPEEREELASDDGRDDGDDDFDNVNGRSASESEVEDSAQPEASDNEDSEEEHIVVTRREEQRDPEAEADFDRELAKLMSESMESRKFDRKQVFDVPLPMRRNVQSAMAAPSNESDENKQEAPPVNGGTTMKFALLSRRGNKQQTRAIDLPADSNFAVAMRSQQQAERAEQQRIKSLVLNYDLNSEDASHDALETSYPQQRFDKAGTSRGTQRARKLQLSDVDW
ncbi:nonsense-mediated mRNA decay factor [Myriangium duriaei CBS 260.36]|uniref:Nonsense-mediated mRNA decay factor n=1 Tax=Myriangium duriaei CBS 260.36 TaxID=1168546 RepID=A0A9P4J6L5_9PEZI|nr:nonsense-mediated mRNA decay factor [Myriangium duriaei CBS 260.36]